MDKIRVSELYDCKTPYIKPFFESATYPWELLPKIKDYIALLLKNGIDGFTELKENVLVGKDVIISDTAYIEGPAVIGHKTVIRQGAYIRGNVITGQGCVIGNSTELKSCVLSDFVQVPHYNYVGDSVLGEHAHMGAGSICSNLKADGKAVTIRGNKEYYTGLRKVGAFLGDNADIGCSCVLNPGTVIGKNTRVYPLTSVRGVIKENVILKGAGKVVPII